MPFRSKAQMRYFFAAERRGELPKGTARRWAHETPNLKSLPERVSKKKKKGFTDRATLTPEQQEQLKKYRRAYIRAKVIFPLVSLVFATFGFADIPDISKRMNIDPNLATFLMALQYGLSGLGWSEYLYPWAVTPWNRALNRMLASGVISGAQHLLDYYIGPPLWLGESSARWIQKQRPYMLANILRSAISGAAISPVTGALLDWMRYGSRLSPIPEASESSKTEPANMSGWAMPYGAFYSEYPYGYMYESEAAKKEAQTKCDNYYLKKLYVLYEKYRQNR